MYHHSILQTHRTYRRIYCGFPTLQKLHYMADFSNTAHGTAWPSDFDWTRLVTSSSNAKFTPKVMLLIHFFLWENTSHFPDSVGLCCKALLLDTGTSPHPQRGACGTKTRVSLPAKNFHPWRRPALSPWSQPLCSVLSPAAGQKRNRKLWWFSSFQPWLHGGSGLLPAQLWRNWAEMEDKHVPHQSSLCRCCSHDPAANKR